MAEQQLSSERPAEELLGRRPPQAALNGLHKTYDPQLGRQGNGSLEDALDVDSSSTRSEVEASGVFLLLARFVLRWRWFIIGFHLGAGAVAALGALRLISITNLDMSPAPGSLASKANQHFEDFFPGVARGSNFVGILEVAPPGEVRAVPGLSQFTASLREGLNASAPLLSFTPGTPDAGLGSLAPLLGLGLSARGGSAMLFQWAIAAKPTSNAARSFGAEAVRLFGDLASALPGVTFSGVAGLPINVAAEVSQGESDLMRIDSISMPLAMMVLWYLIRSWRLLLIPLACMCTSASLSFGIMFCVGHVQVVMATTPSIMMSVLIALSIDYSLFITTRFDEELARVEAAAEGKPSRKRLEDAIVQTVVHSGFLVVLSGSLLLAAFAMLVLVPDTMIQSLGVGCGVGLLLTILVHVTLGPALLAAFPAFFAHHGDGAVRPERSRAWDVLARVTTSFPTNLLVIAAVVGATIAVGHPVLRLELSQALQTDIPRGSPTAATFEHIASAFGAGSMLPYLIMLEPASGTVLTREFWESSQRILASMEASLQGTSFQFPPRAGGVAVPWALVAGCLGQSGGPHCDAVLHFLELFTNPARTAMWGVVRTAFDPLGGEGSVFLQNCRAEANAWSARTGVRITVAGMGADILDLVASIYRIFPAMVTATLLVVLVLLGVACRSVLAPIRSVASILLTLLWVYGLAVRTFQDGLLEWTGVPNLTAQFRGVAWAPPVICLTLVVGICLDYDIFLLSRATELRRGGADAAEAVRGALTSTGGIISAAGVIMSIAFGGLLFSTSLNVGTIAFFLVFAVLYDTFVVRCLFSPAVMSLLGPLNWWPGALAKDAPAR